MGVYRLDNEYMRYLRTIGPDDCRWVVVELMGFWDCSITTAVKHFKMFRPDLSNAIDRMMQYKELNAKHRRVKDLEYDARRSERRIVHQ